MSQVATLKVDDFDSTRMLIRIEQGKGRKDRTAMLLAPPVELPRPPWREGRRRGRQRNAHLRLVPELIVDTGVIGLGRVVLHHAQLGLPPASSSRSARASTRSGKAKPSVKVA